MAEFEEAEEIRPIFNKILEICADDNPIEIIYSLVNIIYYLHKKVSNQPIEDFANKIKIFLLEIEKVQPKNILH
jgi:transcriptional regulator